MSYKKHQISAAILAGGRATRLNGIDKGNIELQPHVTIMQHLLTELSKAGIDNITIVANNQSAYAKYERPIINDNYHDCGPIAGIESALKYYQSCSDAVLFLPCDLPRITVVEIERLKQAYFTQPKLVYATTSNLEQPLCAVLNVDLLMPITNLILQGEKKIAFFWQQLNATPVFFTNEQAFVNINTFEDLHYNEHQFCN